MERLRRLFFKRPHWLIVGLGNPGERYAATRHNVGFQALDHLAKRHYLSFRKARLQGLMAGGEIEGHQVALLKPLTYVNRSGDVVAPLLKGYGLPLDRLLIIYDDLDLPLGRIRIREQGSAGGHKGMASIIDLLGPEVPRLRVGIGRKENLKEYVLSPFTAEERVIMEKSYERIADAVECLIREGLSKAMERFNREGS
ncbi:MAG TPA: aminoacyl-tRNA hydrolase [Chloroflexi bacterium]|nr:aminoacyl-tRNA hydrolase [Chloroflexota bacterium]